MALKIMTLHTLYVTTLCCCAGKNCLKKKNDPIQTFAVCEVEKSWHGGVEWGRQETQHGDGFWFNSHFRNAAAGDVLFINVLEMREICSVYYSRRPLTGSNWVNNDYLKMKTSHLPPRESEGDFVWLKPTKQNWNSVKTELRSDSWEIRLLTTTISSLILYGLNLLKWICNATT